MWIDGPLSIGAKTTNGQWLCFKKKIGLWLFSLSNLKLFEGGFSCPESIAYNQ